MSSKISWLGCAACAAVMYVSLFSAAQASITSTFDSGSEGWVQLEINNTPMTYNIIGANPVGWSSSGGNPDGHIWGNDFSDQGWSFGAPSDYRGDKSAYYGGTIEFDLLSTPTTQPALAVSLLWLRSSSVLLIFTDTKQAPGSLYTHYEMVLEPAEGWSAVALNPSTGLPSGSFAPATETDFLTTLSNLTSVEVRGDWVNGNETSRLDNFSMVPEPATICLLAIGSLVLIRKK
ncbi:MAG: hypothetical protein JW837_13485 [Sedimentisphaerales bacterium]|nr:hypothetical protein [Sedimentisphaerales bacterium]